MIAASEPWTATTSNRMPSRRRSGWALRGPSRCPAASPGKVGGLLYGLRGPGAPSRGGRLELCAGPSLRRPSVVRSVPTRCRECGRMTTRQGCLQPAGPTARWPDSARSARSQTSDDPEPCRNQEVVAEMQQILRTQIGARRFPAVARSAGKVGKELGDAICRFARGPRRLQQAPGSVVEVRRGRAGLHPIGDLGIGAGGGTPVHSCRRARSVGPRQAGRATSPPGQRRTTERASGLGAGFRS